MEDEHGSEGHDHAACSGNENATTAAATAAATAGTAATRLECMGGKGSRGRRGTRDAMEDELESENHGRGCRNEKGDR